MARLDNLAGLAIKYNVTVADIKRANGLLSDTAMFAKDTLLIPTRSLCIGCAPLQEMLHWQCKLPALCLLPAS